MSAPLRVGESVKHKSRDLSEAVYVGRSESNSKKVKVKYNALAPYGVGIVTGLFKQENIVRAGDDTDAT